MIDYSYGNDGFDAAIPSLLKFYDVIKKRKKIIEKKKKEQIKITIKIKNKLRFTKFFLKFLNQI